VKTPLPAAITAASTSLPVAEATEPRQQKQIKEQKSKKERK
jgi:hypothetical protein